MEFIVQSQSGVQLFVIPWTIARQAPLSMGFSRQEYWSRLPCPSLGDLPGPGIKPTSLTSPAQVGGFFITGAIWLFRYMVLSLERSKLNGQPKYPVTEGS